MKFSAPIDLKEYLWFVEELQKRGLIKKPIYPEILMSLSHQRDSVKKEMRKYPKDSPQFMSMNIRQASLKLVMVASYGVCGHAPKKGKAVRFFDEDFFNSVTGTAQDIIRETIRICEECGFTVIYGDSTFGDCCVLIKRGEEFPEVVRIKDLWEEFSDENFGRVDLTAQNLFVASYNFKQKKVEWNKISAVIKKPAEKPLYLAKWREGVPVITEDHSLYLCGEPFTIKKLPNKMSSKKVAAPDHVDLQLKYFGRISEIDLAPILKEAVELYNKALKRKRFTHKCEVFLNHVEITNKKCTYILPRFLLLDEDFGSLLGAYIGEGSVVKTNGGFNYLRVACGEEIEWLREIYDKCKKVFPNAKVVLDEKFKMVKLYGYPYAYLFAKLCGYKSHGKKLPSWIFQAPKCFVEALLKNWLKGDGNKKVLEEYGLDKGEVGSKSRLLMSQLSLLIKNLYEDAYIHHSFYLKKMNYKGRKWIGYTWNLRWIRTSNLERKNLRRIEEGGKSLFIKIRWPFEEELFDLEVDKVNNFIDCFGGVILHNTDSVFLKPKIPIDTFKLTLWASIIAKKINYLIKCCFQELLPIKDEDWHILLEPKNVYSDIIFTSAKKKYRGEVVWTENEYHKETDLVGFEAKRSDAFPLMAKVQDDCQKILIESPMEEIEHNILEYMHKIEEDLFAGKYDQMLIQEKTIRKTSLEDYEHADPHVEAAKQLLEKGALRMGDRVSWIVVDVKKGKQIIKAIDPRTKEVPKPTPLGYRYYMNRLWDMVERLIGKSMSTIVEEKMDKWLQNEKAN